MSASAVLRKLASDEPPAPGRRRRMLIVIAAAVALALLGTWLIAFSPVFGVRTIEVRGNHALSADRIRAAADISNGTPLVRVDTAAATKRIEQLADVASAQVSTSFPSTVVINVEERTPVGYLRERAGMRLVDRSGDAYRTVRVAPRNLPRLVVASGPAQQRTAAAVATVANALPRSVRRHVTSIQALDSGAITLVLTGNRLVRWGSADRTALKARLLPALLRHHPQQVDLTNPEQPFTR